MRYRRKQGWSSRAVSAVKGFFAGLGIIGILTPFAIIIAGVVGWCMNIYKLFAHSPDLAHWGVEQIVRLVGLIPIIGAVVGWF